MLRGEMLRVGIAGIGFMGWIHWLSYQKVPGVEVVAVCERDEKRLAGDWTDIKGNFGPPGEKVDLSAIATYDSLEKLFADENIDLIDICLPPSFHVDAVVGAAAAGKHVFCEKPLALNPEDCVRAVEACDKAGKQLMVGHVLPFFPEYEAARKIIDSGEYGELLGGSFKRVISDPTWLPDFYNPEKIGGPLLDLHIHDAHLIRLLFGMPKTVYSKGRMSGEVVKFCQTTFGYDGGKVVSSTGGVIDQAGRPFTHGFEIQLERATMHFEYAAVTDGDETMPLKIVTAGGDVIRPEIGDGDPINGFVQEITEVARSIESGVTSPILSGDLARDAVKICRAESVSVQTGKEVEIS